VPDDMTAVTGSGSGRLPVRLHYRVYGRGAPVLILHGLFGSNRNWSGIARELAEHYQAVTVDLRNHGDSGHAASMGYAEMADDIRGILQRCGLERAHLIGHSLGGKVAMAFALLQPACVDDLIVLDIAPVSYANRMTDLVSAMARLKLHDLSNRAQADRLLETDIPDDTLRRFLLQNLVRTDAGYRWRINLDAITSCLDTISGFPAFGGGIEYRGRTLFLHGGASGYVRPEHHAGIRRYFPDARIECVPDAGHWLHADQPRLVLQRLREFLAGAGTAPGVIPC